MLQEAYLCVLDGRARFHGRSCAKTWLFAVIRRIAVGRRRQRWLRSLALGRWLDGQPEPPPAPSPEAALDSCETVRALRQAVTALPERQRQVVHLVFYQDLSLEETAHVLGISVGSARTHYHRGKQGLRKRLSGERP